jgi:hypothetical protein
MPEPESTSPDELSNTPAMSLGGLLGNIFVSPSEVFDEIKIRPPSMANWLVPTVIGIVVGMIFTLVVFSQPAILQSMREAPVKSIEAKVAQGKMTRQQADQQIAAMEPILDKFMTPEIFKVVGILSAIVVQPCMLFFFALVFWLVGTYAFKGSFEYMKAVEAVGLSTMISIPGAIIYMFLAVIYGSLYMTPGPVLLLSQFDPANPLHVLLQSLNLMFVWYLAVMSIALARLSGTSFAKAACWGFGLWGLLLAAKLGFVILTAYLGGK